MSEKPLRKWQWCNKQHAGNHFLIVLAPWHIVHLLCNRYHGFVFLLAGHRVPLCVLRRKYSADLEIEFRDLYMDSTAFNSAWGGRVVVRFTGFGGLTGPLTTLWDKRPFGSKEAVNQTAKSCYCNSIHQHPNISRMTRQSLSVYGHGCVESQSRCRHHPPK